MEVVELFTVKKRQEYKVPVVQLEKETRTRYERRRNAILKGVTGVEFIGSGENGSGNLMAASPFVLASHLFRTLNSLTS